MDISPVGTSYSKQSMHMGKRSAWSKLGTTHTDALRTDNKEQA